MNLVVKLAMVACCFAGCAAPENDHPDLYYIRQAFVDPSLESMSAEMTAAGKVEWEGLVIDFENDRDVGQRMRHAVEQGVASQVTLTIPLSQQNADYYSLVKSWVLFCERWRIPYTVRLLEGAGDMVKSTRIAFAGRLEGNEILTIRDWAAIETVGAKAVTLEQLQTQLRDDFILNRSHHFEIRLTRQALEGDGAKNLAALVNQLNVNPPPLCWYRIALLAK